MNEPAAPPVIPAPPPQVVSADTVYAVLAEPSRRHILQALADGQARTATDLRGATGKQLDATLKHLIALRTAGLVVTEPNPKDGRRQLYRLSPSIPVTRTPNGGKEMDFGYCLVRIG